MSFFEERGKSAERKFQLDEELRFKAMVRGAKLLGLWVAGQLGLSGEAAETYAKSVVIEDISKPGIDDLVSKVLADFKSKGVEMSENRVRKELEDIRKQVREELMKS